MGNVHLPNPQAASYELAMANRKLVTLVMGMTLMMGLIACLSYLAGRSVAGIRAEKALPAVIPPPVIVDAPVASIQRAKPTPTPGFVVAPTGLAVSAARLVGPQLYLQVAAGSEADFAPLQLEFEKESLPQRTVLIDNKFRLLVGPLRDFAHRAEMERKLREAGRPFFPRQL